MLKGILECNKSVSSAHYPRTITQTAETLNCFAALQCLSTGSHTGSAFPDPHAPLSGEGCLPSPKQPESLRVVSPLAGSSSPDQTPVGTSPPSPAANCAPWQLQASPGGPPPTLYWCQFYLLAPKSVFEVKPVSNLFTAVLINDLSSNHLVLQKTQCSKFWNISFTQEGILLLNHWTWLPVTTLPPKPCHSHHPEGSQPAHPHLFSEPCPGAHTSTNHHRLYISTQCYVLIIILSPVTSQDSFVHTFSITNSRL